MSSAASRLLASEALRAVYFSDQHRCWMHTETKKQLRGVRRILEQRCWPSYDYEQAQRMNSTRDCRRVKTGVRSAREGRNRGSAVHDQLQMVATHGLLDAKAVLARQHRRMEPLVSSLLQHFHKRHLRLVAAELPVYDAALGIGSSIDMVCERKDNLQLVLIELKVGGDNYYNKASAAMENEMAAHNVPNSPLNQAFMQLLSYKILFEQCYGNDVPAHAVHECLVVFVGPSGIMEAPLSKATSECLAPAVHAALVRGAAVEKNKAATREARSRKT